MDSDGCLHTACSVYAASMSCSLCAASSLCVDSCKFNISYPVLCFRVSCGANPVAPACFSSTALRFNITTDCFYSYNCSVYTNCCLTSTINNFSNCFKLKVTQTCKNTKEVVCDNWLDLKTCTSSQNCGEIVKTWHNPYFTCHGYDAIGQSSSVFEISDMCICTRYNSPKVYAFCTTSYNIFSCFCVCRYNCTGSAFCNGIIEDLLTGCTKMYCSCNEVGITPNGLKLGPNVRLINMPYGKSSKSISNIFYELALAGILEYSQINLCCNLRFHTLAFARYGGSYQGPPSTTRFITGIEFCHAKQLGIPELVLYFGGDSCSYCYNGKFSCYSNSLTLCFTGTDTHDVWLGICGLVFI